MNEKKIVSEKGRVNFQMINVTFTLSRFWYAKVRSNAMKTSGIKIYRDFMVFELYMPVEKH
jgi:hypothetical protein